MQSVSGPQGGVQLRGKGKVAREQGDRKRAPSPLALLILHMKDQTQKGRTICSQSASLPPAWKSISGPSKGNPSFSPSPMRKERRQSLRSLVLVQKRKKKENARAWEKEWGHNLSLFGSQWGFSIRFRRISICRDQNTLWRHPQQALHKMFRIRAKEPYLGRYYVWICVNWRFGRL